MWGGDSMWGEILSGVKFHVGWSSMWVEFYMGVEFYVGWNFIVSGVDTLVVYKIAQSGW